jgi:hypothetical protein
MLTLCVYAFFVGLPSYLNHGVPLAVHDGHKPVGGGLGSAVHVGKVLAQQIADHSRLARRELRHTHEHANGEMLVRHNLRWGVSHALKHGLKHVYIGTGINRMYTSKW